MSYTNRTCHNCGFRDIQPNMTQTKIKYKSGHSKKGLGKREVFGSLIGNKKSEKAVESWLSSSSKRNYTRTRTVWMCNTCAKKNSSLSFKDLFVLFLIVGVLWWLGLIPL